MGNVDAAELVSLVHDRHYRDLFGGNRGWICFACRQFYRFGRYASARQDRLVRSYFVVFVHARRSRRVYKATEVILIQKE